MESPEFSAHHGLDCLVPDVEISSMGESTPGRSTPSRSTPYRSRSCRSTPGRSPSDRSYSPSKSPSGRSTPGRSTTPEPPPVPPATYHWEEVRRQRMTGGYPWTHLNKPPYDENKWDEYERQVLHVDNISPYLELPNYQGRSIYNYEDYIFGPNEDHVYEPVTPAASADKLSAPSTAAAAAKEENRHFLRIPLAEEIVMADETGSDDEEYDHEEDCQRSEEDEYEDEFGEDDDEDDKKRTTDESIYEGENENSSSVDRDRPTKMKAFQQKCKVKADVLRSKLHGVTKRKPKQKIVAADASGESADKARRRFGQFATLPKKFNFNAPNIRLPSTFGRSKRHENEGDEEQGVAKKPGGRFNLPRFRFPRSTSESPKPSKSTRIGGSRLSIPNFRPRTWSDASKASRPPTADGSGGRIKTKLMEFGTYPRIFSKRRKVQDGPGEDDTKTPPSECNPETSSTKRKESFHRRFFRSHQKESTPGPPETTAASKAASLAVEEEITDEGHASKESLAEFGDSDLQEVISLSDDCSRSKDTKSMCEHRAGVIEEIDSDEFFLREKGLSRGDVHISNYLSSEIKHVFRSSRTSSDEQGEPGTVVPVRPSRTNSLRKPMWSQNGVNTLNVNDHQRFSTMPKSFGAAYSLNVNKTDNDCVPENIITSTTFEPNSTLPPAFRVLWRTADKENVVSQMPPKPPSRQRMTIQRCSTFDTRSMIDLSRKRSQSQTGFLQQINFSETAPKAPLRRSRVSLADTDRENSVSSDKTFAADRSAPTPPLRRSRVSLNTDTDAEERNITALAKGITKKRNPPPRPVFPGYATVDKSSSLMTPESPMRHRRKKSYDVIKSQEFGGFFTLPRSYSFNKPTTVAAAADQPLGHPINLPQPARPARAYNTLGPPRPQRRRRENEYGDVADDNRTGVCTEPPSTEDGTGPVKVLISGDVIEKMKLRPLPSPPPPPRRAKASDEPPVLIQRRNTDSVLTPFLGGRETSVASYKLATDVSRRNEDVSIAIQTDPLPDGYELDDSGSSCDSASDNGERPMSRLSATPDHQHNRPASRTSIGEHVEQHPSRSLSVEKCDVTAVSRVICARKTNVDKLEVDKLTIFDIRRQHMDVDGITGSCLKNSQLCGGLPNSDALPCHDDQRYPRLVSHEPPPHVTDETMSVQSRVSSMYPEVDSDEDRTSVMNAPTPPRRRSKPPQSLDRDRPVDIAAAVDPSITELSCQLFRLCHSNVCGLFNKVVQQVVPEDSEKQRDLQAALCFLSIVLAGLLILGFGNEKTVHHHHWDFQFPPPN